MIPLVHTPPVGLCVCLVFTAYAISAAAFMASVIPRSSCCSAQAKEVSVCPICVLGRGKKQKTNRHTCRRLR